MQIKVKKHNEFILFLTYAEDEAGQVKNGALYYVPERVFNKHHTFEGLAQDEKALQVIGCKTIQGNTVTQLKQEMEEAESQILTIHEAINHTKGVVHNGSCY